MSDLKQFFLDQITEGNIKFKIGVGNASYKSSRGSFKTKEQKKKMYDLKLEKKSPLQCVYTNKNVKAIIEIDDKEELNLSFDVDNKYNYLEITFKTFEDEKVYGCGEQYYALNLKGKVVPIWVSEHQQVLQIAKKLLRTKLFGANPDYISNYKHHQSYFSSPVFISSLNYGFYIDSDSYAKFSFGKDYVKLFFRSIPKNIKIVTANNQIDLVKKMNNLSGISPKIPDWVGNGAILAMQGGTKVLREKYHKAKEAGNKISGIWAQDWCGHVVTSFGYQVYWNWSVDNDLYEGLDEFIKELKADGVRFLGYINTFLKQDAPLYLEAKEKGYLVLKQDGSVYHIKSTTFDAGIVDLTNKDAYNWYKNIIKENMIAYGLSGWMADFGEYLPTDAVVAGGEASALHNIWPTLWAKCSYEAIKECGVQDEIFTFSRAAYSHTTKYTSSMWNGDQHVDFSDEYGLGSVIPASLSMACSGSGVVHSDIGGYTTVMFMKRDAELFTRWAEMNIFTPVFRTHEGNRPQDNVQFDNEAVIKQFSEASNIYYELKEYRNHILDEYYESGLPVMRPIFLYDDDKRFEEEKKEYMFGEDILVSPVLRAKEEMHQVRLPKGEWIQFFTGKVFNGGTYDVDCPLGLPIAFYKKDSKYRELFENITKNHFKGDIK